MSIKKLFDSANKSTNYTDYQTEKEAYESVESQKTPENVNDIIQETINKSIQYQQNGLPTIINNTSGS